MIKNIFKKKVSESKIASVQKIDAAQLAKVIGGTDEPVIVTESDSSRIVNKGQIKGSISINSGN